MNRRWVVGLLMALAMPAVRGETAEQVVLIPDPAAALVRGHCSACHSLNLVTTQRGDRNFWLKTIRWMQATQNLWPIPEDQEDKILDYLAKHYNESEWGRRPPLPIRLLPVEKNPN